MGTPEGPGRRRRAARQLKDTASRALSGKLLSKATLSLFTDAFGFDVFERERLIKLWEGSAHVRVLSGPRAIREDQASALGPPQVKTLALHRSSLPGPGRAAAAAPGHPRHRSPGQRCRPAYRADTNALTIEVGQGFSGLAGPVYQPTAELFVVDMLLAKPLAAGETATLEYSASLRYQHAPPEFRRIVQSFVENLDIRVEFHPGKLPGSVIWAVWDGMDGPIIERENVALDSQFAVHRYLRLAEAAVGFHWDWWPAHPAGGPGVARSECAEGRGRGDHECRVARAQSCPVAACGPRRRRPAHPGPAHQAAEPGQGNSHRAGQGPGRTSAHRG